MILFFRLRHFIRTYKKTSLCIMSALLALLATGMFAYNKYEEHKLTTKVFKGVIITHIDTLSLISMKNAFVNKINADGYSKRVEFTYLNAAGNSDVFAEHVNEAIRNRYDFIVTIGTPATQAIIRTQSKKPLFYMGVLSPEVAHIFTRSQEITTGVAIPFPIETFFDFIFKFTPDAGRQGNFALVHSGQEENALEMIKEAQLYLKQHNLQYKEMIVSNPREIEEIGMGFMEHNNIDVLYIPNDSTIQKNMPILSSIALDRNIPVYCAVNIAKNSGCIATLMLSNQRIGEEAADLFIQYLNGVGLGDIPAKVITSGYELYLNERLLDDFNMPIPQDIKSFIPLE